MAITTTSTSMVSAIVDATIDALTAANVVVGDGVAPDGSGWQAAPGESSFVGYTIVEGLPGGRIEPQAEHAEGVVEFLVQLRSYGASRSHASQLADEARSAMLAADWASDSSWQIFDVRLEAPAGCAPDDGPNRPRLWLAYAAYRLYTTNIDDEGDRFD